MIRSVDSLASFNNFRSVGKVISAGVQEASMVSVPQFLPFDQSTGFTSSSSESCLAASASGSSESSSFGSDATASSTICLPCSAISLLIRMRSSSESRYSSRWLRLAEMYHHRWVKRCLAGIAGKTKANLQVSVFSDLLDGLLIGLAKPLPDQQRSKRQPHWLRRGASRGVELRSVCSFQRFPWIRDEMSIQRLSESSVPLKGTWNSSIESWPLWCIRYICGVQRLQ